MLLDKIDELVDMVNYLEEYIDRLTGISSTKRGNPEETLKESRRKKD